MPEKNPNEDLRPRRGEDAVEGTERPTESDSGTQAVSTGVGAAGGGLAGAAIGSAVGGPVGTAVGAVIGAVAGGLGGHAVGEAIDAESEDQYWRQQHPQQPYARPERKFEDYQPAYRTGYQGYGRYAGQTGSFEEAEPSLRTEYEASGAAVPWENAREASRAAWTRVQRGEAIRVPISEEQVRVGKREVESGGVNIRKEVRTETVNTPVELRREEIVVERTAAGEGAPVPEDAFREGEVRIPLSHEEPVIEKETRVVGEVHVTKKEGTETQQVSETVRKEDVKVEDENERRRDR